MNSKISRKGKDFILLRGKERGNIFWTSNVNQDISEYDLLYAGNEVEEMVREWEKCQFEKESIVT